MNGSDARKLDQEGLASNLSRKDRIGLVAAAAGFVLLFWPTMRDLVETWWRNPDASHGFLVPVIAGWILYNRRETLRQLPRGRARGAIVLVLGSLVVFFLGHISDTRFFARAGMLGVLLGSVAIIRGWSLLRTQPFPFFFLIFAIPPPGPLIQPLRLALRRLVTRLSADSLTFLGFPAVSEGNVLVLGDHSLGIADACAGIRSLVAIIACAVIFAYVLRAGLRGGVLLTLTAIPVAVATNTLRVVLVGVALAAWDLDLSKGWPHQALGVLVFAASIVLLFLAWRFYRWLFQWEDPGGPP